jgi:CRAL/TRIO domain
MLRAPSSSVKAAIDAEKEEFDKRHRDPLFNSTSQESLTLLHISFAENPTESLGAKLINCSATATASSSSSSSSRGKKSAAAAAGDSSADTANTQLTYMFLPGYAVIGKILGDDASIARKADVQVGDVVIAVNGMGFRRFAPDYKHNEAINVISYPLKNNAIVSSSNGDTATNGDAKREEEAEDTVVLDHRVVSNTTAYDDLLARIKAIKADSSRTSTSSSTTEERGTGAGAGGAAVGEALLLTLERYGWDERPNSWGRFLMARDYNVPAAMQMLQEHELWKTKTFPINLAATAGLQLILKERVICEIDIDVVGAIKPDAVPPTVYVNYGKLLALQSSGAVTADDVVHAFVIFTERVLQKSTDPRRAKLCQFIDLTDVSVMTSGLRVETLKKIYNVFEPNYPETLAKMVMYPVPTLMVRTLVCYLVSLSFFVSSVVSFT